MSCEKTGFDAFLAPYNMMLHGDAFKYENTWIFRICEKRNVSEIKGFILPINFIIDTWDVWFDEREVDMQKRNSTMICSEGSVRFWSYEPKNFHLASGVLVE